MKKIFFSLSVGLAFILFGCSAEAQTGKDSPGLLRHVVMITFRDGAPADSIQVLDNLYETLSKSPYVRDFEWGVSISGRDSGVVKHIYVTTFATREDMKRYSKNPAYSGLFKISLPIANEVTVADYWIKK